VRFRSERHEIELGVDAEIDLATGLEAALADETASPLG
jgi:hypothetical protein